MTIEQKTQMVIVATKGDIDGVKHIVEPNLNNFDADAWQMFFQSLQVVNRYLIPHKDFYLKVLAAAQRDESIIRAGTTFECVVTFCLFQSVMKSEIL